MISNKKQKHNESFHDKTIWTTNHYYLTLNTTKIRVTSSLISRQWIKQLNIKWIDHIQNYFVLTNGYCNRRVTAARTVIGNRRDGMHVSQTIKWCKQRAWGGPDSDESKYTVLINNPDHHFFDKNVSNPNRACFINTLTRRIILSGKRFSNLDALKFFLIHFSVTILIFLAARLA